MRPAHFLVLAYLLMSLNLSSVGEIGFASLVERSVLTGAGMFFMIRRGAYWEVIGLMGAVIMMIVLLALATPYPLLKWGMLLFSLNQLLVVYFFLAARYSSRDAFEVLRAAAFAPILIVGVGMLYDFAGIWPIYGRGVLEGGGRLQGSLIPAFLAGFSLCGMVASVQLATATDRRVYYFITLLNCVILLATGARAPAAIGLPLALIFIVGSPRVSFTTKIAAPAIGIVVLAALMIVVGQPLIERLAAGGSSGRDEIWAYFLGVADRYYWTGIGFMQSYYLELPHELLIRVNTTAVHNDYIRLSAEIGTPGTVAFYVILCVAFLRASYRNAGGRALIMSSLGLLSFLAYSWTDNAFGSPSDYLLLLVSVVAGMKLDIPPAAHPKLRRPRRLRLAYRPRTDWS